MMPTWMPDGSKVVFASARNGPWDLYSRAPAGNDEEQVLLQASEPENKYARAVTPDGRHVLFHSGEGIWTLSLDGEHRPRLLLRSSTPGSISHARVSPDGRWLAYASTETGQSQVYVTSYPELSERWLISPNGGTDPQWRRDGRELFYLAPDQTLMAVAVSPGAELKPGTPAPLFRARFERTEASGSAFSPTGDGQRFLVNEAMADDEVVLNVRMNWTLDER
jgi:Tol biopolymer transport system component